MQKPERLWLAALLPALVLLAGTALAQRPSGDYRLLEKVVLGELRETKTPGAAVAVVVLANRTGSILGRTLEKALELSLPLKPKPQPPRRRAAAMTAAEMETYAGTYVNGLLRVELFVRGGRLFRRDFYPPTAEEGPGRAFEVTVEKVGANRFAFTPPGEATPAEFVLVPGPGRTPEYLHSFMGAARRVETSK